MSGWLWFGSWEELWLSRALVPRDVMLGLLHPWPFDPDHLTKGGLLKWLLRSGKLSGPNSILIEMEDVTNEGLTHLHRSPPPRAQPPWFCAGSIQRQHILPEIARRETAEDAVRQHMEYYRTSRTKPLSRDTLSLCPPSLGVAPPPSLGGAQPYASTNPPPSFHLPPNASHGYMGFPPPNTVYGHGYAGFPAPNTLYGHVGNAGQEAARHRDEPTGAAASWHPPSNRIITPPPYYYNNWDGYDPREAERYYAHQNHENFLRNARHATSTPSTNAGAGRPNTNTASNKPTGRGDVVRHLVARYVG